MVIPREKRSDTPQIKGRILLATSHFLYLVDLESGESAKVTRGQGLYYGITWDRERIYALCADFHPIVRKLTRPKVVVLDEYLRKTEEMRPPFHIKGGVHQAHFDPESEIIWFMSSKDDAAVFLHNGKWDLWHPVDETLDEWRERLGNQANKRWDQPGSDIHHLNSVWSKNGKLYFVAHNWGPSEIYVFDAKTRGFEKRIPVGKCVHNVWCEGDEILVCSSIRGQVVNYQGEIKCSLDGFVRGAAVTETFRLIGLSTMASRKNRVKTDGGIQVLTPDWTPVQKLMFDKCGQVHEIRYLSGRDICHNGLSPPVDTSVLEGPVGKFEYV